MSRILKEAIVVGSTLIGGRAIVNAITKNEKNTTNGHSFINTIGGVVSSAPSYIRYVTDSITQSKINKHNNVINKWVGNRYKEPSLTTYECAAWTKLYAKETFGVTLGRYGDAFGGWLNIHNTFGSKWKKVYYKPGMIPPVGAILFWGPVPSNGNYGHVAIADTGSTSGMLRIIEQNGANGRNGLGPDAIRRIAIQHSKRGPFVGWYTFEGWGNVHSDLVGVGPENPNDSLAGSNTTFTPGNSLVLSGPDQRIVDFLNTLLGLSGKKKNDKVSKFGESLRKYTTGNEDLGENGKLLTENINGIMITLMIDLLRRIVGLPTLKDQANGGTKNNISDPSSIPPSDTGNTPILTTSGRIFLGDSEYAKKLNKLANVGDIRKKGIKGKNEFALKSNNPAGMKYGKTTYNAMVANGATPTDINGRVPSNENGTYIAFKDMSDGIAGWRAFWGVYIGWAKNNKFTPPHLPDVKSALQIWGTRTLKTNPSFGVDKNLLELTDNDFAELCYRQLEKESPALFKYMNTL